MSEKAPLKAKNITGIKRHSTLILKRMNKPINKISKGFLQAQTHLVAKPDLN